MIVAIANTKGGVGKTTLATNIAVMLSNSGRSVLFVDSDEQRTGLTFTQVRTDQLGSPGFAAISLYGSTIYSQVKLQAPKYDDVVIDVGGRETKSMRAALSVADVVLVPVQPRSYDIWALADMAQLIDEAREPDRNPNLVAFAVLNAADPFGRDNQDALAAIKVMPQFRPVKGMVGRRKIFANSGSVGRAVSEYVPKDTKAVEEMQNLISQIMLEPAGGYQQ
jgi:chromosome partitioning protein